jgi:hypothetical protein
MIVLMWTTWALSFVAYLFIFNYSDFALTRRGVAPNDLKAVSRSGN